MLVRFLGYGLLGLALEVVFTSIGNAVRRKDRTLAGHSYLWMLPIYGLGGLALEALHNGLSLFHMAWWVRGLAYLAAIYGVEYLSGLALRRALGRCPWDYGRRGFNLKGLIRLDYAPAWFACGLLFERVESVLSRIQQGLG